MTLSFGRQPPMAVSGCFWTKLALYSATEVSSISMSGELSSPSGCCQRANGRNGHNSKNHLRAESSANIGWKIFVEYGNILQHAIVAWWWFRCLLLGVMGIFAIDGVNERLFPYVFDTAQVLRTRALVMLIDWPLSLNPWRFSFDAHPGPSFCWNQV